MSNLFYPKSDDDKEYRYKFLVYPNITNQKNIESDSYVDVIRNVINVLNVKRGDIHFTLIVPSEVESLNLENVEQVIYEMPSYPNAMRIHFDFDKMQELINWQNKDFDVLYSHLPEHTSQLANLFYNNTDIRPMILGYCHWYEIDENTKYDKRLFLANIAGTLEMVGCGVNSEWLKKLVLKRSSEYFNQDIISKLDGILKTQYLGVESINLEKRDIIPNSILFNHRDDDYTGWKWFIKTLDSIYDEGIKFRLYTTQATIERPYCEKVNLHTKADYLNFVRQMYIGVGCFEEYSAWSIAVTDGLSQGVPYLLPNEFCYPEMVKDYPLIYTGRDDFKNKLNSILKSNSEVKSAKKYIEANINNMSWFNTVPHWFNDWKMLENMDTIDETDSYLKLYSFIKENQHVSKSEILKHMNWGIRIPFSKYRNRLRMEKTIRLTKELYEYIG